MLRTAIRSALVEAMKARDGARVATLRLIEAALKNRDIEARTGGAPADDDLLVAEVLRKMAKQRRESIAAFAAAGRADRAAEEAAELAVIESFLPQPLAPAEAEAAIRAIVAELGAAAPRDLGRVMAEVKARLAGRVDMGAAAAMAKAILG